ncbi:hypothetical protein [Mycoplasmopsis agassizii]|uniref:Lipoprotein n=1 Tax=Mycoplasmopsis agassizii TaxID=33922 RepID=A0ABX4H5Z7_9BACT|nr:hypothetical protein [Mycoplasmopsis agassizii]PAF55309.1 hypothetical protein CJF60_01300 [Mycoplasmopsis agassizii]SMC15749.1 hypothetical protein SAMN02745179_00077 [Mycoplasmopsis agassizii]
MSILNVQKSKIIKKLLILLTTFIASSGVIALASCSSSDFKVKQLEKDSALYEKQTSDNKPYLQFNMYGYPNFTFSNWIMTTGDITNFKADNYPIIKGNGEVILKTNEQYHADMEKFQKEKGLDSEDVYKYWVKKHYDPNDYHTYFIPKFKWNYKQEQTFTRTFPKSSNNYNANLYFVDDEMQKYDPSYQKSVSLIKNEDDLKASLRLDEKGKTVYKNYLNQLNELSSDKKSHEDLEKEYLPWSSKFNYENIKNKLDFDKYSYLFIKDVASQILFYNIQGESRLDGGVEISKYNVDINNKTINLEWGWVPTSNKGDFHGSSPAIRMSVPDRLTSFMIPVEKDKLSEFDFNEWKFLQKPHK